MALLNFGSLNIDKTYRVPHFVREGETLAALSYTEGCGGKGLNQSIAAARAGAKVFHAGKIGPDGEMLRARLEQEGVDTGLLRTGTVATGHAVIEVDGDGANRILLFGGANMAITPAEIDSALSRFGPGDLLLLQNEIAGLSLLLKGAAARGIPVALNPSPLGGELAEADLSRVSWFLLNRLEGRELTGMDGEEDICLALGALAPGASVALTLGGEGAMVYADGLFYRRAACPVTAVDTTGAGDTFTGYFLAGILAGQGPEKALERAVRAAALAVTRPGAADAVPTARQVDEAIKQGLDSPCIIE